VSENWLVASFATAVWLLLFGMFAQQPAQETTQNAAGLKSNLLVAHGTGNDNVHFSYSLLLIDHQICEGKSVELMRTPGRGDGVSDVPARRVGMNRVTQFFLDDLCAKKWKAELRG
jgi:hypothetical protein